VVEDSLLQCEVGFQCFPVGGCLEEVDLVDLELDNLGVECNPPEVVCSSKLQGEVCNSRFLEEVCYSNREAVCNLSEVWVCLLEACQEGEHRHQIEVESQMEDPCRREEV